MYIEKNPEQESADISDYLEHVSKITNEQVAKFRIDLEYYPEKQKEFDELSPEDKKIITAFDYLTDENVKKLIEMTKTQPYQIGLHNVPDYLNKIYNLTGDQRYKI